ncbi:hypothetical protein MKQ70_24580 [Chitinophaga sedimenti]|uniref:hypothetical protein n=1 Tax=Chitinophaga sedimenti TaxID=2033606 RepID=UPI002006800E|nr:hypothetical protein [Chitinophaga sedimenti]MCK7558008.1 hypothetical protein [Chitinophaga sedimenti]
MWNRIKIALYTLLSTVNVSLVGQMRLSEVLVVMATPFMFDKNDFYTYPYLRKILIALFLLLGFRCSPICSSYIIPRQTTSVAGPPSSSV